MSLWFTFWRQKQPRRTRGCTEKNFKLERCAGRGQFGPGTGDVTDTTFNDFRFNSGNLLIGNVNGGRIGQFQLRYVF